MRISALVISLALLTATAFSFSADTALAANHNPVVVFNQSELEPSLSAQIMQAQTPVVIVFKIAPQSAAETLECSNQDSVTATIVQEFSGRVTVITADAGNQSATMVARARIAVCPTHLLVLSKDAHTGAITAFRRWGYMDQSQFEQLIEEEFGIMP